MRGAGVLHRVDEGSTGTQHDSQNVRLREEALPLLVYLVVEHGFNPTYLMMPWTVWMTTLTSLLDNYGLHVN